MREDTSEGVKVKIDSEIIGFPATPILEGEDAKKFWDNVQNNADKKVPLVPTPNLKGLRDQIMTEWRQDSKISVQVKPFLRLNCLWIGFYWDHIHRDLYFCPLPTIGIKISIRRILKPIGIKK